MDAEQVVECAVAAKTAVSEQTADHWQCDFCGGTSAVHAKECQASTADYRRDAFCIANICTAQPTAPSGTAQSGIDGHIHDAVCHGFSPEMDETTKAELTHELQGPCRT